MRLLLCFSALLCNAITTPATVHASGVTSKLFIHIPKALARKEGYDHREALFGVPPYGGSIQQNLYYADSDLCNPNVDTHKGYPERDPGEDGKPQPWPAPYILMVDRGGCSFVTKIRNAQRSGAAAVIIADNSCLCSRSSTCKPSDNTQCESTEPVMADDGSGSDISIPSFLMYKEDADPVKEVVKTNQMVRVEMVWALPTEGDVVEYDLWTTPSDIVSRDFLHQFKDAAIALDRHATFTPHMYIYDGIKSGCQGADGENNCYTLCTNNGQYCATDPDNDLDAGISGADVVSESLRRVCIWNKYGKDGIGKPWWDYVEEFMYRCDSEQFFSDIDCAKDAMKRAGVDFHVVANCVADSGGLEANKKNTLLETQLAEKAATGVVIVPTIYVNKTPIRGALSFATVFKAICAGFASGHAPAVCQMCSSCSDEFTCVVKGHCSGQAPAGGIVSIPVFVSSLAGVVLLFACIGFVQWRRSQAQMRDQVRGILAQYMPLDENNKVETVGEMS